MMTMNNSELSEASAKFQQRIMERANSLETWLEGLRAKREQCVKDISYIDHLLSLPESEQKLHQQTENIPRI